MLQIIALTQSTHILTYICVESVKYNTGYMLLVMNIDSKVTPIFLNFLWLLKI